MPTFIKPGFWNKKRKQLAGELDLDRLIQEYSSSLNYKSCVVSISIVADGEDSALSVVTHENNLGANLTWTFGLDNKSIICTADSSVFTTSKTWTNLSNFRTKGGSPITFIPIVTSTGVVTYEAYTVSTGVAFPLFYDPSNTPIFIEIRVYN